MAFSLIRASCGESQSVNKMGTVDWKEDREKATSKNTVKRQYSVVYLRILWKINVLIYIKCIEQSLLHSKHRLCYKYLGTCSSSCCCCCAIAIITNIKWAVIKPELGRIGETFCNKFQKCSCWLDLGVRKLKMWR